MSSFSSPVKVSWSLSFSSSNKSLWSFDWISIGIFNVRSIYPLAFLWKSNVSSASVTFSQWDSCLYLFFYILCRIQSAGMDRYTNEHKYRHYRLFYLALVNQLYMNNFTNILIYFIQQKSPQTLVLRTFQTPRVGLEPTTLRLTAECSTTELSRIMLSVMKEKHRPPHFSMASWCPIYTFKTAYGKYFHPKLQLRVFFCLPASLVMPSTD